MLPRDWRIIVINQTGVQLDFTTDAANNTLLIAMRPWNLSSAGALVYGAETNIFTDGADLADAGVQEGTAVDNSSNLYMGASCVAILTTDAVTAGTIEIYMDISTDGGTTFPSDAPDFVADEDLIHLASLPTVSASDDRTIAFEI